MNKHLNIIIFLLLVVACKKETKPVIDVSNIKVNIVVDRFEQKFYNTTAQTLGSLKNEYPYLFPGQNQDTVWLNKISNVEEVALYKEAQSVFNDFETEKIEVENLFKHVKYYHPTFKSPKLITLITNLDYNNKVIYADSLLFISLDMYLGKTNNVYKDFPEYMSKNYDKSQLAVDIARSISEKYLIKNYNRQFIDIMINEGKKQFLIDSYLPAFSNAQKISYTADEIGWVTSNEAQIWSYFVENDLLYSTDPKLHERFIATAPFSKFYLDIDKESPGSIGVWLGWQIVKSYMNNNNVTLQQLLQTNAEEIFKKSKYKPKK